MKKMVFINLPVKNLAQSTHFYEQLGFVKNPMFSNENASALAWSEEIMVMLLTHDFYAQFIPGKRVADSTHTSEVGLAISMESRDAVEKFASTAKELGGRVYTVAKMNEHESSMFGRSVEDLDGHLWEPMWMDMNFTPHE